MGSLFRTADAVGVTKVFLVGITSAPIDRFGRARSDIAKVALGAEKTLPWEARNDLPDLIVELQQKGIGVIALEQSPGSLDYRTVKPSGSFALIVGSETEGLSPDILALCDKVIDIPMRGKKESLNVSVATGIALFLMRDL